MSSLHWVNLMLYVVALLIVLLGVKTLGSGTASCFADVSAPPGPAEPAQPLDSESPLEPAEQPAAPPN